MQSPFKTDKGLSSLVTEIHERKSNNRPLLLLGAECSVTSGCASAKELTDILIKKHELSLDPNNATIQDIEGKLGKALCSLDIEPYFANIYPSQGYWFLSELISRRYFDLIITTNYDTCLEQALFKIMNSDNLRVISRGDLNDKRVDDIIKLSARHSKVFKLNGDFRSINKLLTPEDIQNLRKPLKTNLYHDIVEKGIIIIGYSKFDCSIIETLPEDKHGNYWYVNIGESDSKLRKILASRRIQDSHVFENINNFDEFMGSLIRGLGEKGLEENRELKKAKQGFNEDPPSIIDSLVFSCNIEIDQKELVRKTIDLHLLIEHKTADINNLVFVHDPNSPGGTEVLKIMREYTKSWIKNKTIFKIKTEGRKPEEKKRQAFGFIDDNDKLIDPELITVNDKRFILIDCVSFTGSTLSLARNKLLELFGKDIEVRAAVVFSGPEQENQLETNEFCIDNNLFYKVETVKTFQIQFPWGYVTSTKPLQAQRDGLNDLDSADAFNTQNLISSLPRPWGNVHTIIENQFSSCKILFLNPGEKTSKHKHYLRNEIFLVLDKCMTLQIWDRDILLERGDFFRIPAGTEHRLIGRDVPCRVLEIVQNYNSQVEDIKRTKDEHGREERKGDI